MGRYKNNFHCGVSSDQFPQLKTAIVMLALVITPISHAADAVGIDLTLGSTVRSFPLSAVIEAESGYGILLWGTSQNPFSGYVRPRIAAASSLTYNSMDVAMEFFPLAILGGRIGKESVQNDLEYLAYDCHQFRCVGRFYRTYIEGEFSLGYGPVFIHGSARVEAWDQPSGQWVDQVLWPSGRFLEPTSGLSLKSSGQTESVYRAVVGLKLDPVWTAMVAIRYAESDDKAFSRMPLGLLRYKDPSSVFSVTFGAALLPPQ